MKKILIVDDQEDILEILEIYIEGSFEDVCVIKAFSGNEAIEVLDEESFDSIICDFRMPDGNGDVVFRYNQENDSIPFAWHSSTFDEDVKSGTELENVFVLSKPVEDRELEEALKAMMSLSEYSQKIYRRIKPEILKRSKFYNIPIFIHMNDDRYIQICFADDDNLKEVIEKYETKGLDYLYVKKRDLDQIYKLRNRELKEKIERIGSVEDIYFVTSEVIDEFYYELENRGVTKEQIEITNLCVEKCLREFNRDMQIKELMASLINDNNYVSSHSLMTVHIANLLLTSSKQDLKSLDIVAKAAILHDLKLPNMRLARVRDFSGQEYKKLSMAEKNLVMSHGIEISSLLNDKDLPKESLKIIQNHELFGNEIKRGVELSEIELFFHISHEVAHYICEVGFLETLKIFVKNEQKYIELVGMETYTTIVDFLNS